LCPAASPPPSPPTVVFLPPTPLEDNNIFFYFDIDSPTEKSYQGQEKKKKQIRGKNKKKVAVTELVGYMRGCTRKVKEKTSGV
jgi:hypothetical protein